MEMVLPAVALFNLSKLSVWWLRLGIAIERIKPGQDLRAMLRDGEIDAGIALTGVDPATVRPVIPNADDAAAQDDGARRHVIELQGLIAGHDATADVEARQRASVRTGGEHDGATFDSLAIDLDGVRCHEPTTEPVISSAGWT